MFRELEEWRRAPKGQELESMCLGMYPGNEQARSCTNTVVLSEQANIRPKQTLTVCKRGACRATPRGARN